MARGEAHGRRVHERDGQVPREIWKRAGELGLLCLTVPEEYGGAGVDFSYSAIVVEELSRAGATGPIFYLHSDIVAPYLVQYGTEAQKRRWLPGMVRGEIIGAIGMTEPGAGSDVAGMRTRAEREDGPNSAEGPGYRINGQKIFISNGQLCDLLVLAAKTDATRGAKGVSLLLVDTHLPGFGRGRRLEKMGLHAQDTSELFFEDLRVGADALLGEEGRGFVQLMEQLPQERLLVAIAAVAPGQTLRVLSGERHMGLTYRELAEYRGERGQRGAVLPRGWRKVDGLEVE
jgi:acyl-CoA dehydrogenase